MRMAEGYFSPKLLLLLIVAGFMPCLCWCANWEMSVTLSSVAITGNNISATAYLGENYTATDAYDWNHDLIGIPPYSNPNYVMLYFPHTTWGGNNGNFVRDVRSNTPVLKTWNTTLIKSGSTNNNYVLSWVIPPLMPDYYSPKLIIDSATINMRTDSSYEYYYTSTSKTCSIRLDFNAAMPYLKATLPELLFSNNLQQSINLNKYFGVLSGSLNFSVSANEHINQSIVAVGDSIYWKLNPGQGWQGTTSATITATANGYSKIVPVTIIRDETNNVPLYNGATQLSVLQNQSLLFSWAEQIVDPDLDPVTITVDVSDNFTLQTDYSLKQTVISPRPAFKGSGELKLSLSDGIHTPSFNIPITVHPSTPQTVQNIVLSRDSDTSILCTWDAVSTDISSLPLGEVHYRVSAYENPDCSGTPVFSNETTRLSVNVPYDGDKLFFRIITINQ
jgi:hypothetical protein